MTSERTKQMVSNNDLESQLVSALGHAQKANFYKKENADTDAFAFIYALPHELQCSELIKVGVYIDGEIEFSVRNKVCWLAITFNGDGKYSAIIINNKISSYSESLTESDFSRIPSKLLFWLYQQEALEKHMLVIDEAERALLGADAVLAKLSKQTGCPQRIAAITETLATINKLKEK